MATYQTRVVEVEAIQLSGELILSNGTPGSVGKKGDWLVQYSTGLQVIMTNTKFCQEFQLKAAFNLPSTWPGIGPGIPRSVVPTPPWTATYENVRPAVAQAEREIDHLEGNRG